MSEPQIIYIPRYHDRGKVQQAVTEYMLAEVSPFWNPQNVNFKPLGAHTVAEFIELAAECFGRAAADGITITAH